MNNIIVVNVIKKSKKKLRLEYIDKLYDLITDTSIDNNINIILKKELINGNNTIIKKNEDILLLKKPDIVPHKIINIEDKKEDKEENSNGNIIGIIPIYKIDYNPVDSDCIYWTQFYNILVNNNKIYPINIGDNVFSSDSNKYIKNKLSFLFKITNTDILNIEYRIVSSKKICVIWLNNSNLILKYKNELKIPKNNRNYFFIKTFILLMPYNIVSSDIYLHYKDNDDFLLFDKTNIYLSDIIYPYRKI